MSSLEVNKIIGAVVGTGLAMMVIGTLADALVDPDRRPVPARAAATAEAPKVTGASDGAPAPKAAAAIEPIGALLASADLAKGKKAFRKCVSCHSIEDGGKNKIGPNLWNIVNAERGKKAGYSYSKALSEKAGTWTYDSLNAFLERPRAYIKGTKMSFGGIKKAQERAAVIAYLRSLSASPAPLP